jgi:uncharacterized protein (DUF433 family)
MSTRRTAPPPARAAEDGTPSLAALPIYNLPNAARLTQVYHQTVRAWVMGSKHRYRGEMRRSPGIVGCAPRWIGDMPHVTFLQLLSLRAARGLRAHGMPLHTLRRIAMRAAAASGEPVPMATLRFRTDGAAALLALDHARRAKADPEVMEGDDDPVEIGDWETLFADMIDRSLFNDVDWLGGLPVRWWPMGRERSVALEPGVAGGMPHVAGTRVRTAVIAADMRSLCGGEAAIPTVGAAHGLTARQVRDAAYYETEWLGPLRSDSSPSPEAESAPSEHPGRSLAA